MIKNLLACAALCCVCVSSFAQTDGSTAAQLTVLPAHPWGDPTHSMLLDATRAGSRIVAVGEHGIVVLSDDGGHAYRQAKAVPASSTLSSVYFTDPQHGWAVGQWGVILDTVDGGETWTLQRADTSIDQPLFSVYFKDASHGWAVGLWSLLLETADGGHTWNVLKLPPPPGGGKADRNLYRIFADGSGTLFVAAEQGIVLRSRDGGSTWEYRQTGNKGSLWTGTAAADGSIFVGGLLGHLYRSHDGGDTWTSVDSGSNGSITELVASGDQVFGVGLDGFVLNGSSTAARFTAKQRPDRASLTALVVPGAGISAPIFFSKDGILKSE
ncbi:YCF48-related protein [Caballeronia sp. SEWSISQ10-4 2]|uniref:WD40/YVTN/BNR-like repeat-containing protein n=1 Tax=Caballeronia sp. SEWSISQ10-4 2 TaxID=2937438 RepID=UPI002652EB58|nr:YCF48-related protein [Caballeronia sp. SEWSISQ10-4 2]MDN7179405.1 YCF48-related protein [Caballeronia sp. SEWSISQ10-4 2]